MAKIDEKGERRRLVNYWRADLFFEKPRRRRPRPENFIFQISRKNGTPTREITEKAGTFTSERKTGDHRAKTLRTLRRELLQTNFETWTLIGIPILRVHIFVLIFFSFYQPPYYNRYQIREKGVGKNAKSSIITI